ncbi:hypothetical protein IAU60_001087 [Kwoniella sp. DSM 27419]
MGNDQSRTYGLGGEGADAKAGEERPPDYYQLLQVDEEATADEIKRSYRKLALIHHPDKNAHRVEEATKLFADLQHAYEVLSDPNERAFYDNHRNAPVAATDDDIFDHVRSGDQATNDPKSKLNKRRHGDPGVRLEQLMRFFDPKLARKMDDTNEGFYSVYRTLFALLASDETLHTPQNSPPLSYPSFGDSTTTYAPPAGMTRAQKDGQTWARDFYAVWVDFVTEKRFEWVVKWDVERAESRDIRRLMEKENKKVREDYRKEYNDTVRQLVTFIQHRDPRYKAHQSRVAKERALAKANKGASSNGTSTPSTLPTGLDPEAARLRHEERLRSAAEYEEQSWQKLGGQHSDEEDEEEEEDTTEQQTGDGTGVRLDDGMGGEFFECVACGKTFASEASWANHERSKNHKQAVWRLKKEMMAEDRAKGLSRDVSDEEDAEEENDVEVAEAVDANGDTTRAEHTPEQDKDAEVDELEEQLTDLAVKESEDVEFSSRRSKKKAKKARNIPTPSHLLDTDRDTLESQSNQGDGITGENIPAGGSDDDAESGGQGSELSKRDKRRAREAKKKAEEEARKAELKEARKAAKKGLPIPAPYVPDTFAQQEDKLRRGKEVPIPKGAAKDDGFVMPKQKGKGAKGRGKAEKEAKPDEFGDDKVQKVVGGINEKREKMLEKWGENWSDLVDRLYGLLGGKHAPDGLGILCLGIGKPFSDRTAQIQLALLLELATSLQCDMSRIEAFDPMSDEGDKKVLSAFGIVELEENLRGQHTLQPDRAYLLYMPHAPKQLYESLLFTNFSPSFAAKPGRVLLGNDLGEYVPGFVRQVPTNSDDKIVPRDEATGEGEFVKAKKKRRGKGEQERQVKDGVLPRLVQHMSILPLGTALPETNLPGFARAFLSLAFQWLEEDVAEKVDWETQVPEVEWEGGEVIG